MHKYGILAIGTEVGPKDVEKAMETSMEMHNIHCLLHRTDIRLFQIR